MIFDELGLPKEQGATDKQDSARLAGIMTVFDWPQQIDLMKYVVSSEDFSEAFYVRHPKEKIYDFSRDQAICLMAGLWKQRCFGAVDIGLIKGKDWFSPSQIGHIRICQGKKARWYENLWFWFDVLFFCFAAPKEEPNQILCMLMVNPNKKYLKFVLKHNKYLYESIRVYWATWRGESALAEHIIKKLEELK